MSQSLYTAMGGISSAQTQLNVVSNNIANMNTVAFKQSNVTFQELFNQTTSTGNSPTSVTGGKNPMQVGLGVQVGTIAKDYTSGTWTSTGKTTDMMIEGNGFFTVRSSTGEVYMTRAGNFTFDSNGDMVNAQGYKILGADKIFGTSSSNTIVHVPQEIVPTTAADDSMWNKPLAKLNNCTVTSGDFSFTSYDSFGNAIGSTTVSLDTSAQSTMGAVKDAINPQIQAAATTNKNAAAAAVTNAEAMVAPASVTQLDGDFKTINDQTIIANQQEALANATSDATQKAAYMAKAQDALNNVSTATTDILNLAGPTKTSAMQAEINAYKTGMGMYNSLNVVSAADIKTSAEGLVAAGDKTQLDNDLSIITDAASTAAQKTAARTDAITLSGANSTQMQIALGQYEAGGTGVKCECDATTGGEIKFAIDGNSTGSLTFKAGSSNFLGQTQLGSAVLDKTTNTYSSKILNYTVDVEPVTSLDKAQSISSYSIAEDGSIEATYSNGDKLSIEESSSGDNTFQFKYTTSTGVVIVGNDCTVNKNVAVPANFQIQLANVTNVDGLVDKGTNLYMSGPNSGDMIFTSASAMGLGSIKSGGLESSNVDISKQFSDMILAQRAVESNSRVFSSTNDILQTLVRLGE